MTDITFQPFNELSTKARDRSPLGFPPIRRKERRLNWKAGHGRAVSLLPNDDRGVNLIGAAIILLWEWRNERGAEEAATAETEMK